MKKGQSFAITVNGALVHVRCDGNCTYVTRREPDGRPVQHDGSTRFVNYLAGIAGAEYTVDSSV